LDWRFAAAAKAIADSGDADTMSQERRVVLLALGFRDHPDAGAKA